MDCALAPTRRSMNTAFYRAAKLLAEFRENGMASWALQSGADGRYELILSNYSPGYSARWKNSCGSLRSMVTRRTGA